MSINLNFPKSPQDKFLYKNQQNSTNSLEDISSNVDFGPKRGKFGPTRHSMIGSRKESKFKELNERKNDLQPFLEDKG